MIEFLSFYLKKNTYYDRIIIEYKIMNKNREEGDAMNKKKNTIILTITVLFLGFLLAGGTFAYWTWRSNNSNITFNTAKELKEYIEYDEGESQFVGSLTASNSYLTGSIHSTIAINKKASAANIDLVASIMMDINVIGTNMKNSSALKWVVTNGNASNPGTILASGNFIGTNAGDTLTLVPSLEVTIEVKQYTIWIWLDQNENPSELLSGETLDTNVWTQIDQVEGVRETFEITRISANNQNISATVVNNKNKITNYAVTTTNATPSSWTDIPQADQANVYTLNYTVNETGTYYVWFKDEEGNTVNRDITITTVDTTGPVCTFDDFTPNIVNDGTTATINLTCIDNESQIASSKIETTDLTKSNNGINITSINKTVITNGYKYTITVTGTTNDNVTTISLPANIVKNTQNQGNAITTSGNITVVNNYTITINAGNGVSSVSGTGWTNTNTTTMTKSVQYGTVLNLCEATASLTDIVANRKNGYTGCNATVTSGNGSISNNKYTVTAGNATITLSAAGIETPVPTISIDSVSKIYGTTQTNLSASISNTYDSGITVNYTYYYDTNPNGSYANTQTNPIAGTSHKGIRYYKVKATATDNTLTSSAGTSSNNVSLTLIRTSYTPHANNCGTLSSSSTLYAYKGENQLYDANTGGNTASWPTLTAKTGYTLNGWYTSNSGGSKVLNADGTISSTDVTGYINSSNFDSGTDRTLYAQCSANTYTISYNLDGGTASNPTGATYDTNVVIAAPTRANYTFTGWTSTTLGLNAKSGTSANTTTYWNGSLTTDTYFKNLVESGTVTLVANWSKNNYLNVDTNTYYETLQEAFTKVTDNQTIRVYAVSVNETGNNFISLSETKTGIKLDLYGHTISLGTTYIYNSGNIDIYSSIDGGVIEGAIASNTFGVIFNNGTLTTSATASNTLTIKNTVPAGNTVAYVLSNNSNKSITLNTGTTLMYTNNQNASYNRYVVFNNGTLNINGATLTNNPTSTDRYNVGVYNNVGGTINMTSGIINTSGTGIIITSSAVEITGGTITSAKENGVTIQTNGTLTVGNNSNAVNTNSPVITSTSTSDLYYGIRTFSNGSFNFYDGKVVSNAGTDHALYTDPNDIPDGYYVKKTTTDGVETATLDNTYTIEYTLNGGTASNPTSAIYNEVVEISNPTKTGYAFTGWTSTTLGENAKTGSTNNPTDSWDGSSTTNVYFKNLTNLGETVTLVANWVESNYLIVETNTYYATLTEAFAAVASNQTIRATFSANSITESSSAILADTKTGVKFDLNGKTITIGANTITNNGGLDIYSSVDGALLSGSNSNSTGGVILNNGTLTTSNTAPNTITIRNTQDEYTTSARVIVNNEGKTVTLKTGTTITMSRENTSSITGRYLIQNSGTLNVNGATLTNNPSSTNAYNRGINSVTASSKINMTSGTINTSGTAIDSSGSSVEAVVVSGGSITSKNGSGIYNKSTGTIIYGTNDATVNLTNPIITSNATTTTNYGIRIGDGILNFYDGKVISAAGANHSIDLDVSDYPVGYAVRKVLDGSTETAELFQGYAINYNLNGGTASNPTTGTSNQVIEIAHPTKTGYEFDGWTSETIGSNAKTGTTNNPTDSWDGSKTFNTFFKNLREDGIITMVANWVTPNYLNIDTGRYYTTLNTALEGVASNQTIRLVTSATSINESSNAAPTLASGKTGVKLDLNGKTISLGTKTLTNNGGLEIYSTQDGGVFAGTNVNVTAGVILNNGTLITSNTTSNTITIQNTAGTNQPNGRVIVNSENATVTLKTGTTVKTTNYTNNNAPHRYTIDNSGTLNINGATIQYNPNSGSYNSGINNTSTGKINMTAGTITTNGYAINNASVLSDSLIITGGTITSSKSSAIENAATGTIILGVNDGTVNENSLTISSTMTTGTYYGIRISSGKLKFYDGKVKSSRGLENYSISGPVYETATGYVLNKTITGGVETATLVESNAYYNYQNVDTGIYYSSLYDALGVVTNNQTIKVYNTEATDSGSVSPTLAATKTGVKIDLYGHTATIGTKYITNHGGLEIYSSVDGGVLQGGYYSDTAIGVITNYGVLSTSATASNTLTIQNTAAAGNYKARTIVNKQNGVVTLKTGTTISMTTICTSSSTRYLIGNGGTLNINGASLLNGSTASNVYNKGIENTYTGNIYMTSGVINVSGTGIANIGGLEVTITGGNVTSTKENAIYNTIGNNQTGVITLGVNDGTVYTEGPNAPVITSNTTGGNYAIKMTYSSLRFYDGKAVSTRGKGYTIYGGVTETPVGYAIIRTTTSGTETAQPELSNTYYNYLNIDTNKYFSTLYDALLYVKSNETVRVNNASVDETNNRNLTVSTSIESAAAVAAAKTGVKLDLYGHTLTLGVNNITNNGELDIYSSVDGALMTGTNERNNAGIILNNGILTTSNTASNTITIRNTAANNKNSARVFVNNPSKSITVNEGTTLEMTVDSGNYRYLIENNGSVTIDDAELKNVPTSTNAYNRGIYNNNAASKTHVISGIINTSGISIHNASAEEDAVVVNGGSITSTRANAIYNNSAAGIVSITGGTISATGGSGLYNNSTGTIILTGGTVESNIQGISNATTGTITIGENDGTVSTTSPVIISTATTNTYYGVANNAGGTLNFYDGKIVSEHGVGYTISGNVNNVPTNYAVHKTTENGIETAILMNSTNNITINKDGSAWTNSGMTIYLSTNSYENDYSTNGGGYVKVTSGNVASFDNLTLGEKYYIWATPGSDSDGSYEYTGVSFTAGGANKTINYYTLTYTSETSNAINSYVLDSVTYNQAGQTIFLDNHTIDIIANPASGNYIYKYEIIDEQMNILQTVNDIPRTYTINNETVGIKIYTRTASGTYQNMNTGVSYSTIYDAFAAVQSNETIIVNGDITDGNNAVLASGKTGVKFDLNGKRMDRAAATITNNGELEIYSSRGTGILTGTNTSNGIINNLGTLIISKSNNQSQVNIVNTSNNANVKLIVNRNTSSNLTIYSNTNISFTSASSNTREIITNNGITTINGGTLTGTTNDIGINNASASAHTIINSGSINTGEIAILNSSGTGTTNPAVKIVGGTISTNSPYGSIRNEESGTIKINGGTISTTDGEYGTIFNSNNGTIDIESGVINSGTEGFAIISETGTINVSGGTINGTLNITTGTLNVSGGTINETISNNSAVNIYGTANITGGTITSTTNGIYVASGGTLTLGASSAPVNQESPLIISSATSGTYYGINNDSGTFNFYDGKIVSHRGTNYAINGTVSGKPNGYYINKTIENNIETATLGLMHNIYINKDGSAFNNSGITVYLSTSDTENNYNTLGGGSKTISTGNLASFDNLNSETTYYIWTNPSDPTKFTTPVYTGITFTPTVNGSSTINYYSFTISRNDTNIQSITLDGEDYSLTSGSVLTAFLNNHQISIEIECATGYFVYKHDVLDGVDLVDTLYFTPSQYTLEGEARELKLYSMAESNNYQNLNTGTGYATLYDALAAVNSNETIRANADVDESANTAPSLASGKTGVKLDLNGKDINMGTKKLTNNGGLDIYSSVDGAILESGAVDGGGLGVVYNTTSGVLTTSATASNTLTIRNITTNTTTTSAQAVTNQKTMTLNKGTTLSTANCTGCTSSRYVVKTNGTLTINGAIIENNPNLTNTYHTGINIQGSSKMIMTSGSINTSGVAIYRGSTASNALVINGGTITSTRGNAISTDKAGSMSITGGNLTSYNHGISSTGSALTINITGGKITVTGPNSGIYTSTTSTINFSNATINSSGVGINNLSGTLKVTSGTIIGKTGGIVSSGVALTLGTNDSTVTPSPKIVAKNNIGVTRSGGTFNFYDGMIIANAGKEYTINGTITNLPTNYEVDKIIANGSEVATLVPYSRMIAANEIINGQSNGEANSNFLASNFKRGEIGTITLAKTAPAGLTLINGIDISEHEDFSVMMYQVDNGKTTAKDYYIIQSGGVRLPTNSSYLFYSLPNLTAIYEDTIDSIANTNYVSNMAYMFAGNPKLHSYNLTGSNIYLDTIVDMSGMFMDDPNLDNVTIGFEAEYLTAQNLESTKSMFALNNNLKNISFYVNTENNISDNNLTNLANMFDNSTNLLNINGIHGIRYNPNANLANMLNNNNNLSTNTQDNILKMLSNNSNYENTKTLKFIGINSINANNIKNYNTHWPLLSSRGWTTGYEN